MKVLLIALFATFLFFFLIYLGGSFVNKSFNLDCWTQDSLEFVGTIGTFFSIIIGLGVFTHYED